MPSRSKGGLDLLLPGFLIGVLLALLNHYPSSTREISLSPPDTYPVSQEKAQKASKKVRASNPQSVKKKSPVRLYWAYSQSLSSKEIQCLALNIYHEARGEPHAGKVGVGQVTLNRVNVGFRNKTTVCQVVYDSQQFSWTLSAYKRTTQPQDTAWKIALQVAHDVAKGLRVRGLENSLHYHANWISSPPWSKRMLHVTTIGQHVYLADNQ